jgi:hypothetical protein
VITFVATSRTKSKRNINRHPYNNIMLVGKEEDSGSRHFNEAGKGLEAGN